MLRELNQRMTNTAWWNLKKKIPLNVKSKEKKIQLIETESRMVRV